MVSQRVKWYLVIVFEEFKDSEQVWERLSSDRHPAADDATGKSFEGDGRGASFFHARIEK